MKTSTVRPSSYREWQENDKEEDSDWICIDDGNLFEGTRIQFENGFFSNAENICIVDWVAMQFNGLEVEFYKNESLFKSDYAWNVERDGPIKQLTEEEAKKLRPEFY